MGVYGDLTDQCLSECGVDQDRCQIVIVCSDNGAGAPAVVWFTIDSGATWNATAVVPFAAVNVASSTCMILGDRWIIFLGAPDAALAANCSYSDLRGAAASWTITDMGGTATASYITNSYVHDAGSIWACGGRAGPLGGVHHSHDRGVTWTYVELATAQVARDVATCDGDTIYVVGDANMIEVSEDGGHTFTALTVGPAAGATALTAVRCFTPDHVIVGGVIDGALGNQMWYTTNGTATTPVWTAIPFAGSTAANTQVFSLSQVPQAPRQHLFMVQGATALATSRHCFRSLDGGRTWVLITDLTNQGYTDIFACDSNTAWISEEDAAGVTLGGVFYATAV